MKSIECFSTVLFSYAILFLASSNVCGNKYKFLEREQIYHIHLYEKRKH